MPIAPGAEFYYFVDFTLFSLGFLKLELSLNYLPS
jgi:hypothetical protein